MVLCFAILLLNDVGGVNISLQKEVAKIISQCKSKDEVIGLLRDLIVLLSKQEIPKEDRIKFWELISEEVKVVQKDRPMQYITTALEDLVFYALQNIELIIQEEKKQAGK